MVFGPGCTHVQRPAVVVRGMQSERARLVNESSHKNRIARYLTRMVHRMETEFHFDLYPLYGPALNTAICDILSRRGEYEVHVNAEKLVLERVDIEETQKWYFADRAQSLSLILPTDHTERDRAIMRQVGKRADRTLKRSLLPNIFWLC